jgi:hypothetical protein
MLESLLSAESAAQSPKEGSKSALASSVPYPLLLIGPSASVARNLAIVAPFFNRLSLVNLGKFQKGSHILVNRKILIKKTQADIAQVHFYDKSHAQIVLINFRRSFCFDVAWLFCSPKHIWFSWLVIRNHHHS